MRVPSITEILSSKIQAIEARLPVPISRADATIASFADALGQSMQATPADQLGSGSALPSADTSLVPDAASGNEDAALMALRLSGLASQALAASSAGSTSTEGGTALPGGTAVPGSHAIPGNAGTAGPNLWPRLNSTQLESIQPRIDAAIASGAAAAGLDPLLLKALIANESGFQPFSLSPAGAMGLTQLMPGTAGDLGVTSPYDIEQNVSGGARYLRQQLNTFGGDLSLALAAYNAGPNAVRTHGGIPPYQETQSFIGKVLTTYSGYRAAEGSR